MTMSDKEVHDSEQSETKEQNNQTEGTAFKVPKLIGPKLAKNDDQERSSSDESESATTTVSETVAAAAGEIASEEPVPKPKETVQNAAVVTSYKPPSWSGMPAVAYELEVLKGGVIVQTVGLSDKPYHVVGRMTACDVVLEHPSISRYHAAITYRAQGTEENPVGYYLYDLKSTHGTWLNKQQIEPRCYHRLRVGYMIKFGGSSRVFIVQGPGDDQDEESELSVTELKELRKKQEEILEREEQQQSLESKDDESPKEKESDAESGIDWGMGEDAIEENDMSENPFALDASAPNEELYVDDPKKTLRGWFEREGYTLEYKVEEKGYSQFLCRIQLPLDSPTTGQPLYAEANVKGKKKESVIACALEACRILDRHGLLRQATHESRKRKERNWEEDDFYDSDEDTFLDRTGTIEKKREQRIHRSQRSQQTVETHESLLEKLNHVREEIKRLETARQESQKSAYVQEDDEDDDALDTYMATINNETASDKCNRTAQRLQLSKLKQEEMKLQQLVDIAAPANLPEIRESVFTIPDRPTDSSPKIKEKKLKLPNVELPSFLPNPNNVQPPTAEKASENETETTKEPTKASATPMFIDGFKPVQNIDTKEGDDQAKHEEQVLPAHPKVTMKLTSRKKVKKHRPTSFEYDESNPDYAMWLPPEGQSGDGRTRLNEKFGY